MTVFSNDCNLLVRPVIQFKKRVLQRFNIYSITKKSLREIWTRTIRIWCRERGHTFFGGISSQKGGYIGPEMLESKWCSILCPHFHYIGSKSSEFCRLDSSYQIEPQNEPLLHSYLRISFCLLARAFCSPLVRTIDSKLIRKRIDFISTSCVQCK